MKILLIIPKFHDYELDIVNALKRQGHEVFLRKEGLSGKDFNIFDHIAGRFNYGHYAKKYRKYIEKEIDKLKGEKIDCVILFHGGLNYSAELVDELRNTFKDAKFIYYAWDTVGTYQSILSFYKKFDTFYSFSREDADKYGMRFLPLFYPNDYIEGEVEYDYCSIMSYWPQKRVNYLRIKGVLPEGVKGKDYLYMRKINYRFSKLAHPKNFEGIDKKNFAFKPLSRQETYSLMAKSRVLINCPLGEQNGLGFGIYEALRLKKKVITTIKSVKEYDFYTPDNIFVVDDSTQSIPKSFFETPFNEDYELTEKYSPDNFVKQLLSD